MEPVAVTAAVARLVRAAVGPCVFVTVYVFAPVSQAPEVVNEQPRTVTPAPDTIHPDALTVTVAVFVFATQAFIFAVKAVSVVPFGTEAMV